MANGVIGGELNIDFSGLLHDAEKFDKKIQEISSHAKELGENLQQALKNFNLGGLDSLKDTIQRLSNSKISLSVDDKGKLSEISSALDKIIATADALSSKGIELFDTQSLYTSNNNLLATSDALDQINARIDKLKNAWSEMNSPEGIQDRSVLQGFVPPTHKNGTEYRPESKTYQNALKTHLEEQARKAIEERAIMTETLNWAKMTEDEKSEYLQKKLRETLNAEKKFAMEIQKEYDKVMREIVSLTKQQDSLRNKEAKQGIDLSPEIEVISNRFIELNERKKALEDEYGQYVVELAKKYNAQIQSIYAKRIEENAKAEKKSREEWLQSPRGALMDADLALRYGSKNELEQAKKRLKIASGEVSESKSDTETLQKLRDAYEKVTAAIERLNLVQKDESTLQPTIRNEYSRLLTELDKVIETKEKLAKTQSFQAGDADAKKAYDDLIAYEEDLVKRRVQLRENAGDLLDEVERKHAARRAMIFANENEKSAKALSEPLEKIEIKEDKGLITIQSRINSLMDDLEKAKKDIEMYKAAIGSGKKTYIDFGQEGLKEAESRAESLMNQIEALSATYDKLKNSSVGINQKGTLFDEANALNREREIEELRLYYEKLEEEIQQNEKLAKQQSANRRENYETYVTSYEGAMRTSQKAHTYEQEAQAIKNLEQARATLSQKDKDYATKLNALNEAINRHKESLKQATLTDEQRAKISEENSRKAVEQAKREKEIEAKRRQSSLDKWYSHSPQTAIDFSKSAKSINDQIKAIQYLKQARDKLNRGSFASEEEYRKKIEQINNEIKRQQKEVDKLTDKNGNLGKSHRHLMDTAGQLQRKLALLFSVSAIQGYVNKLITVRGEFELQAKSLEVLLQNKDEANRLWNQTVQLAVKSPFTVKELVSYTKQLAAYRIESEKLFETNKMLADVSAGLGVDMGRLILAFGQVKAANFLRGTELRQFSEAGVNMLDELAGRFTVLEGRAVSVGEVFERVSKRMVTFADVEAVFKTITSEGGAFYQMQEKQAETLRGMVTNLKDQIALMLNDIGMSKEGVLKGLVSLTVTLVKNWRDIVPLIDMVAGILITRLLQKGMVGILRMTKGVVPLLKQWRNALRGATVEATAMGTALGKVTKANAWLALIGLIASLGFAIYDCVTSASKLEEELGRIDTDLTQRLEDSISGYISLAKTVTDASKSIEEQEEALIKLNSAYEDILPQEMLTIEYLQSLKGNYEDVTDAMRLYYDTLAIEQKKAKVEELYGEDIITNTTDLINDIKDTIRKSNYSQEIKDYLLASVGGAVNSLVYEAKSGKFKGDIDAFISELFGRIAKGTTISGVDLAKKLFGGKASLIDQLDLGPHGYKVWTWDLEDKGVIKNIRELTGALNDYTEALDGVEGIPGVKPPLEETEGFEKATKAFVLLEDLMSEYVNFVNDNIGQEVDWEKLTPQIDKEKFNALISLFPGLKDVLNDFYNELIVSAQGGEVEFKRALPVLKEFLFESAGDIIKANSRVKYSITSLALATEDLTKLETNYNELDLSYPFVTMENATEKANTAVDNLVEKANKKISNLQLNDVARQIYNLMEEVADLNYVSVDVFSKLTPDANESIVSYRDKVEKELKRLKQALNDYQIAKSSALAFNFAETYLENAGVETEEELNTLISLIEKFYKALGGSERNTGKNDIFSQRLSFVKKLNKEYKDLLKKFEKSTAINKIGILKDDAIELGFDWDSIDWTNFDQSVEKLFEFVKENAKNKKQKVQVGVAQAEIKLEYDKDAVDKETKQIIDDIQKKIDKYELSVELDKIGIPKDIAKSLFGIEATDLAKIKKDLEKQISDLQQAGGSEDRIKDLQSEYDKIIEMENKQLEEIAKNYLKYLKKSNAEAVNIVLDGERQKQQIQKAYDKGVKKAKSEEDEKAWKEWKKAAEKGVDKDTTQKLQQQIWKDIQSGPLYKMIYEDPERFSYNMIDTLISSLQDLKKNTTDVEILGEIQNEMDKLYSLKFQKNPFKAVEDGLQEIKKWENSLNANVTEAFGKIGEFGFSHNKLMGTEGVKGLQSQIKDLESLASVIATIDTEIKKVGGMLQTEKDNTNLQKYYDTLLKVKAALSGIADSAPKSLPKTFEEGAKGVMAYAQAIGNIASAMDGLLAQLGVAEDSSARVWLQNVQMVTSVITAVATLSLALIALQATMGPIGWIALAVAGIAATVASIFGSDDKKKQEEIERLERQVRKLESAYKDLKKAIESAYSVETLKGNYEESIDNINKRIESRRKMIYAEFERKNTNQGRIDEWLEEIKELEREKEELQKEIVTGLGGSYDIRNTTREFVEAWIEAFNETGDGLSGLKDNFKEFFKNILIEQAIMKGAGTIMQPLLDEINKSLEDDYKLSNYEMEGITKTAPEVMQELDNFLTLMFGENSPLKEWISESADNLTGLQRGIQGITESQADIIAAYLNSMRAYVADNNLKLTQMLDAWTNTEVENPMVAQLKIIATQTTAIHDLLGGLTKGGHSEGGKGLKVFIN